MRTNGVAANVAWKLVNNTAIRLSLARAGSQMDTGMVHSEIRERPKHRQAALPSFTAAGSCGGTLL